MTAEEIVKALADAWPMIEVGDMYHICALCEVSLPVHLEDHKENCSWRLAKEFMEERVVVKYACITCHKGMYVTYEKRDESYPTSVQCGTPGCTGWAFKTD
jgi:hypothetical protein